MSRRGRGILLVVLGLALMAAGVLLYAADRRQERLAGESADILLRELEREIRYEPSAPPSAGPGESTPPEESALPAMPTRTLSGYDLVGILRIPAADLALPVLDSWSEELLHLAPCRYSGSLEGEDLVILGHNYRTHLGPLRSVQAGDEVELTDVNGVTYRFAVALVETVRGDEGDRLPSGYPLTIFTCTADSRHRLLVRCGWAEE